MMLLQDCAGTLLSTTGMCPQAVPRSTLGGNSAENEVVEDIAGPWLLGRWQPAVDIDENVEAYIVKMDAPGIANGTLEILAEAGVLRITGQRKANPHIKTTAHRTERQVGTFVRCFKLPRNADTSNLRATYKQGVLTLVLPKTANKTRERTAIRLV